jgi:hypothetical protein
MDFPDRPVTAQKRLIKVNVKQANKAAKTKPKPKAPTKKPETPTEQTEEYEPEKKRKRTAGTSAKQSERHSTAKPIPE